MTLPRIYQAIPLLLTETPIALDRRASHHLRHVLRKRLGDRLRLFNGEGGEYDAKISHLDKQSVYVTIHKFYECNTESALTIHLVQSIVAGDKMDFIVQKAVELGVKKITPLLTTRCHAKLPTACQANRLAHWHAVVMGATEQSGRTHLLQIDPPVVFLDWLEQVLRRSLIAPTNWLICSPSQSLPFDQIQIEGVASESSTVTITLLIGPEGGFSDDEVAAGQRHGCRLLYLGPRILRTETAAIAAITLLQSCYGDMQTIYTQSISRGD